MGMDVSIAPLYLFNTLSPSIDWFPGIDLPACSVVIRMDNGISLAAYQQSRGRIRSLKGSVPPRFIAVGSAADKRRWDTLVSQDAVLRNRLATLSTDSRDTARVKKISLRSLTTLSHIALNNLLWDDGVKVTLISHLLNEMYIFRCIIFISVWWY